MREGGSGRREGGLKKGTREEGTELGEGGRVRRREGATERGRGTGRSGGGREIGTEGNFHGCTLMRTLANIQYTLHKTTHNAALAVETLVLEMKNSEQV